MLLWITLLFLIVHLLSVNLASAGPLLCIYYERAEGRGNLAAGRAGRSLAKASVIALLLGIATGLIVGVLRWNPEFQDVLKRLSRKVHYGGIEILFSLVLMVWHWRWWRDEKSRGRVWRYVILLLAGTNLLYHFPTLFAVIAHLRREAGPAANAITASDFRQLLTDPSVLAEALHVTMACVAVAGTWLIYRSSRLPTAEDQATARPAAGVALAATVLQLPIGIWLTTVYPAAAQRKLMGGDPLATLCFVASMIGALSLMHHQSVVTFRADSGRSRQMAVALLIIVVALMTMAMTLSRQGA